MQYDLQKIPEGQLIGLPIIEYIYLIGFGFIFNEPLSKQKDNLTPGG